MKDIFWIILFFLSSFQYVFAQEMNMKMGMKKEKSINKPATKRKDTLISKGKIFPGMMDSSMKMHSGFSIQLPMNRDGSGTSWLPDDAPIRGIMFGSRGWQYMIHYNIFLRYDNQDIFKKGSRGSAKFDAPNMGMFMAQHGIGEKGLLNFTTMLSLDPITVGGSGYPLLYQTGESWKGQPLVDRQHPHDLFSELAVSYTQSLSPKTDLFFYLGYPGEPALGPVTFMHRPSGMDGPDAPIGHHWQDATHITFGVATLGFRFQNLKIEASSFTGREPNENRYNFDKPRFDSYSARLSYNPSRNWALQVSRGFIKSPEALRPDENVTRTTASASFASQFKTEKYLTANIVWGINQMKGQQADPSIGLEGAIDLKSSSFYFRYEWVKKSSEELVLNSNINNPFYNIIFSNPSISYPIQAYTLGFNQKIFDLGQTRFFIGGQASMNITPEALLDLYGKNPISGEIFLRITPRLMKMHKKLSNKMDNKMIM